MKVVLIDDNDLDLLINEQLIIKTYPNWSVKVFNQGRNMMSYTREQGENNLPDIIVSDLNMPGMSGADIVIDYFQLYPDSTTRVLLLSATVRYEEEELASKLGERVVIMEKPLDPAVLMEL